MSLERESRQESEPPPSVESQQEKPEPSPSHEQPEADDGDGHTLCSDLDPYHELRHKLTVLGFERGEYSGIPVPIDGISLVIEPSYVYAKAFAQINEMHAEKSTLHMSKKDLEGWKVRNTFHSGKLKCDIAVCEKPDGRVVHRVRLAANSMSETLATLYASDAWGVDQEQAALQTLGGMLKHRQFKQYLLTGMFLETSRRSHVTYIFRRLRPTIALSAFRPTDDGTKEALILCTLCMHPIAYYAGSWAGAMCPTDDIIAHLALMRGDEHMFWRRSNQHPAWRSQSGV